MHVGLLRGAHIRNPRRRWRHFSSILTFNFPFLILMLLHALYERLCTAALNRLPCYGALEVIAHYYYYYYYYYYYISSGSRI